MDIYFEVIAANGLLVRTTASYWEKIVSIKHPSMKGREADVIQTLREPIEIRASRKDENVLLFYRPVEIYYNCVVVKRLNGEGFIVTTYRTDAIKEGARIWPR